MQVDREAMHRRAQRAEGQLLKLSVLSNEYHDRWMYWLKRYTTLQKCKPLTLDALRASSDFWIIRKPKWLRKGADDQ